MFIYTILNNFKLYSVFVRNINERKFVSKCTYLHGVYTITYNIILKSTYNCVFMNRCIHMYVFIVRTVHSIDIIDYICFNFVNYIVYQNHKSIKYFHINSSLYTIIVNLLMHFYNYTNNCAFMDTLL